MKRKEEVNIFDECSGEVWEAPSGAVNEEAAIIIDMQCAIKLQQIQIINGAGDFKTKEFSVFGSHESSGPWIKVFTGELYVDNVEVVERGLSFNSISFVYLEYMLCFKYIIQC